MTLETEIAAGAAMKRPGSAITRMRFGRPLSALRIGAQKRPMSGTGWRYSTGKPPPISIVSRTPSFSLRAVASSCTQTPIASTCLRASGAWEPTWKEKPRSGMPSRAASRASSSASSGSQPNLRDRSLTTPGERKDTRSSSSASAR